MNFLRIGTNVVGASLNNLGKPCLTAILRTSFVLDSFKTESVITKSFIPEFEIFNEQLYFKMI